MNNSRIRVGQGYDLHLLVSGGPLVLAGVSIPYSLGLTGHSDADVLTHAVIDALLGAAALGDIGRLFPDTDPRNRAADSMMMLKNVVERVRRGGWRIANIDATVVTEEPRLAPHVNAMRRNLASALGVDSEAVSVKAKTNEGVDATGNGRAIAVHAVALLTS